MFDNRARSSGSQFIPRDPAAPLILEADPAGITYELAIYRQESKTTRSLLGFSKEIDYKVNRHDLKFVK
jgi:hypothetical protein